MEVFKQFYSSEHLDGTKEAGLGKVVKKTTKISAKENVLLRYEATHNMISQKKKKFNFLDRRRQAKF
jgi:hypothetical protein